MTSQIHHHTDSALNETLSQLGNPELVAWQPVSGGCIADSRCAELADGRRVFIKLGPISEDQFEAEAAGLDALRFCRELRIPEVLAVGRNVLVLEWIESGSASTNFFRQFGIAFARLHQYTSMNCGFEHDNCLEYR